MSTMADPMDALLSFQKALDTGQIGESQSNGYLKFYDEPFMGGRRFSYTKIEHGEIQALSIFGLEDPIEGMTYYNVGYAVGTKFRGNGLAIEAVHVGLEDLKNDLRREGLKKFYLEALVDKTNKHSIVVAEKLFSCKGSDMPDKESGTPSFYYRKLINIE